MSESAKQYGDVAPVYDRLMAGVPHAAWLSRIERAARARGRSPRSALDLACGTGLATELLAHRGYAPVVGVDLSESMIRVARTKALGHGLKDRIEYLVQDVAQLDLGDRAFDLTISLFDSFNYVLDPEQLRRSFVRVFGHVVPGGVFAFDMNSIYALANDLFSQEDTSGPVRHEWVAHWDPATRLCRVDMQFWVRDAQTGASREFAETHLQRGYEQDEIEGFLRDAGFVRIEVFGNYGEKAPNSRSDRWLFVAERPEASL